MQSAGKRVRSVYNVVLIGWQRGASFKASSTPHYAGGIWKRRFHSENASNVFPSHCAGRIRKSNKHRSFWICFWENSVREITWLLSRHRFRNAPCKMFWNFRPHWNAEAGVFSFLRFEERFRKAPFSWRISVDGRTNRRNKAAFLNFSGAVWTGSLSVV